MTRFTYSPHYTTQFPIYAYHADIATYAKKVVSSFQGATGAVVLSFSVSSRGLVIRWRKPLINRIRRKKRIVMVTRQFVGK